MKLGLVDIIPKAAMLQAMIILGGCASAEKLVTLNPVGPNSNASPGGNGPGHLIVHNASHETLDRDGAMAYPHDEYKIYNEWRVCIKRVRNRSGAKGEAPERIDLPPGRYTVITLSEIHGPVAAPVIIKSDLTTVVDLEQPKRIITPSSMAAN